jgi:hypothetical protein
VLSGLAASRSPTISANRALVVWIAAGALSMPMFALAALARLLSAGSDRLETAVVSKRSAFCSGVASPPVARPALARSILACVLSRSARAAAFIAR